MAAQPQAYRDFPIMQNVCWFFIFSFTEKRNAFSAFYDNTMKMSPPGGFRWGRGTRHIHTALTPGKKIKQNVSNVVHLRNHV